MAEQHTVLQTIHLGAVMISGHNKITHIYQSDISDCWEYDIL